jgi:hypothetical protein
MVLLVAKTAVASAAAVFVLSVVPDGNSSYAGNTIPYSVALHRSI